MTRSTLDRPTSSPSLAARLGGFWASGRERLSHGWVDYVFYASFILLILIAASTSSVFFTNQNIGNLFRQIVTNGLISLGQLVVIVTGGIDLSVGAIVALAGIMVSGFQAYMPLPVAILIVLVVGAFCGAINGFLISRFKLQPFIVTLATVEAIRGFVYVYHETAITPSNPMFGLIFGTEVLGPLTSSVLIMLVAYPIFWLFLNRTTSGRAIFAIGGNDEAVRLAGINVRGHIVLAYLISGVCAALAGVLLAARLGISQPSMGSGFELDAIAACVIGGAALGAGGGGSVVGTFGGVLILGLINNLLNLFNVQSYYQQIIKGLIILFAVLARRRER